MKKKKKKKESISTKQELIIGVKCQVRVKNNESIFNHLDIYVNVIRM